MAHHPPVEGRLPGVQRHRWCCDIQDPDRHFAGFDHPVQQRTFQCFARKLAVGAGYSHREDSGLSDSCSSSNERPRELPGVIQARGRVSRGCGNNVQGIVAHHTAPVPETGERHIGMFAILHRAVDVIDAVNLGVTILKTQRPANIRFPAG
jgi:hypothetical protein